MTAAFRDSTATVLESTYRGRQCLLTRGIAGWTAWVAGSPILFDLDGPDFTPAYSWVDLTLAMAGNGLPVSKGVDKLPEFIV